jgi:hypothetical protein
VKDVTVVYVVFGREEHYQNLFRSIKTVRKRAPACKILVVEYGRFLRASAGEDDGLRIVTRSLPVDPARYRKPGFLIWREKYTAALEVETPFGLFLDSDTVMVHDELPRMIDTLRCDFACARHWWVPTLAAYRSQAVGRKDRSRFEAAIGDLDLPDELTFPSAGAFLFRTGSAARKIFEGVLGHYQRFYGAGQEQSPGLTDELFLAASLHEQGGVQFLGTAFNHPLMGDRDTPLELEEGELFGKSRFDATWERVLTFHCDPLRRDPCGAYGGAVNRAIASAFLWGNDFESGTLKKGRSLIRRLSLR